MIEKKVSIKDEREYSRAASVLANKQKPAPILRMLMSAFESYRQKRKIGWSRPQNKYGLSVFKSFYIIPQKDLKLLEFVRSYLTSNDDFSLETKDLEFVQTLILDPGLMGFLFFHDHKSEEGLFEGVTISLGRKNKEKARCRDRVDIIFEAKVEGNIVTDIRRARVYIDPYRQPVKNFSAHEITVHNPVDSQVVSGVLMLAKNYRNWGLDTQRVWEHWTQEYVEYFVDHRKNAPENTLYPPDRAVGVDHSSQTL